MPAGKGSSREGAPGAIFDLDGTLLNTIEDLSDCLNLALDDLGYPRRTLSEFQAMLGNGVTRFTLAALPPEKGTEENALLLRARFKERYARGQAVKTRPYPATGELLRELKKRGWPLGVLSNKDHENTRHLIDLYFPGVFQAVLGARPGVPLKPDPQAALELAGLLQRAPGDIFYLGDSDTDMLTAKNAGFRAAGVSWGFRSPELLRASGAEAVLENPWDLFRLEGASRT
ncbi:MAG: HAD family hydrolase [Deltaproteobacteria bacterium]|jgi:phosphoglycolate phosphatase|nr:HAD family hydrolase [Deltaproteobacteria bacterium]